MTQPPTNSDDDYEYNGESFEEASSDEDQITEVGTDCSSGSHSESESELRDFKIKQNATLGVRMSDKSRPVELDRKNYEIYSSSSDDEEEVVVAETIVELNNLSIPFEDSLFSDRTLIADSIHETEFNPDDSVNMEPNALACNLEKNYEEEEQKNEDDYEIEFEKGSQFGNHCKFETMPSIIQNHTDESQHLINQDNKMLSPSMAQDVVECTELSSHIPTDLDNDILNTSDGDTKERVCDTILANISNLLFGQIGMVPQMTDDYVQKIQNNPEMIKMLQNLDKNILSSLTTDKSSETLKTTSYKTQESTNNQNEPNSEKEKRLELEDGSGDGSRCLKPPSYEHRKLMQPTQLEFGNFEIGDESEFKNLPPNLTEVETDSYLSEDRSLDYDITSQTPTSFNTEDYALHVDILRRPSTSTSTEKMRSTPLSFKNLGRKSFSFTNAQVREIERQNNILLKKMISIKPTIPKNKDNHTKFVDQTSSTRTTSAAVNRKKQQRQIDKDNTVLRRKLEAIGTRRRVF